MAQINIAELATEGITLNDFFVKADASGLASKNTLKNLATLFETVGSVAFRGSIAAADATVTLDGWYFAEDSGTYTNNGGLVISLNNNVAIIIVQDTQTTFSKVDIPISITIDAVPTDGSTNAVQSNGVFDALALKVNISDIVNNLTTTDINKPLSANQGKVLKDLIDAGGNLIPLDTLKDFKNIENVNIPFYAYNYTDFTPIVGTFTTSLVSDKVRITNTGFVTFVSTGYETTDTENRVVELRFKAIDNGGAFGFSVFNGATQLGLVFRGNGDVYLVDTAGGLTTLRNSAAASGYIANDEISLKVKCYKGALFITTSVNGVEATEISTLSDYSFSTLNFAFRGTLTVENPRLYSYVEELEELEITFVNDATGLDTNIGKFPFTQTVGPSRLPVNGPLKTITEALSRGAKNICIVDGTYEDETDLTISNDVNIFPYEAGEVIIDLSEKHLGNTFTVNGTYSNVYQKSIASTVTTAFEDDYTKWLELVIDLPTCAATEQSCFYSGGILYVNPLNASMSAVTIVIPKTEGFHISTPVIPSLAENQRIVQKVSISGVTTLYSGNNGYSLSFVNYELNRCNSFGALNNGFYYDDSFGITKGCISSYNDGDGFNIHGFNSMKEGYNDFEDCTGNYNWGTGLGNDGISFHEETRGNINNCTFLGNTKLDVVHVQSAHVQHSNIKCGSFQYECLIPATETFDFKITNVNASEFLEFNVTTGIADLLISNCNSPRIDLRGTGTINAEVFQNRTQYLHVRSLGTKNIIDNKIKGGTGVKTTLGTHYFDGNSILNCVSGITKDSGTATMGTNNLYNNTTNYNGLIPVSAPEQAKNVSYLEV